MQLKKKNIWEEQVLLVPPPFSQCTPDCADCGHLNNLMSLQQQGPEAQHHLYDLKNIL